MDRRLQSRCLQQHIRIGIRQFLERVPILCINACQAPATIRFLSVANGLDDVIAVPINQRIGGKQPAVLRLEQFFLEILFANAFLTEFIHGRRQRMEDDCLARRRKCVQTCHSRVRNNGNGSDDQHFVFIQILFFHLLRIHENVWNTSQIQHAAKPVVHVHVIPDAFSDGTLVILTVLRNNDSNFRHDMRPLEQRCKPLRKRRNSCDCRHAFRWAPLQIQNAMDAFFTTALAGIPHIPLQRARFTRPR